MPSGFAVFRNDGSMGTVDLCPLGQFLVIPFPEIPAFRLNGFPLLELTVEEGGENVTHHVTGTDVDPGILVDLAPEEVVVQAQIFTTTPEAVEHWTSIFQGMLSIVKLNDQDPNAVLLAESTSVQGSDTLKQAGITVRLPNAEVRQRIVAAMKRTNSLMTNDARR